MVDHNVPTTDRRGGIKNAENRRCRCETLAENARDFGIEYYDELDHRQGIVHIIGPEQGFTLPGMTIVCGDSHTSTHGAFGALAHGIGTSEVEHVLATQTLIQKKAKNMRVTVDGTPPPGVGAKDIILAIIGHIGTAGGTGHVIEYAGEAIRGLSMEGRMTVCNMIDRRRRAGRHDRAGRDDLRLYQGPPQGADGRGLGPGDGLLEDAPFGRGRGLRRGGDAPRRRPAADRHLGHQPGERHHHRRARARPGGDREPGPAPRGGAGARLYGARSPTPRSPTSPIERVFLGSCTNGRIEDLRAAAKIVAGKTVHEGVNALVVPGSGLVKEQAEAEGLDKIFLAAGFEWREPGCSMCLAMNDDRLKPGERCASTSNRNFEGRQGFKGRTHLVSPSMAAAAAIAGRFVDIRNWG